MRTAILEVLQHYKEHAEAKHGKLYDSWSDDDGSHWC